MAGRPVSLKGHMHVCPMVEPGPRPHIGGPVTSTAQGFVTVNGVPIATVIDTTLCTSKPGTASITGGSGVATIQGKKIARFGDSCQHEGKLVQGVPWITSE